MLIDVEIRERLDDYCRVRKMSQQEAANELIKGALHRLDGDVEMKARMDRAKALKAELANL